MSKKMLKNVSSTVIRSDNQKKSESNRMWNAGLATLSNRELREENTRYISKLGEIRQTDETGDVLATPLWMYFNHYLNQIDWLMVQRLQIPF